MQSLLDGKVCRNCGESKPHSEYRKKAGAYDGLQARCKVCAAEGDRRSREHLSHDQRERMRRRKRAYYAKHPEASKRATQKWYTRHVTTNKTHYRTRKNAWQQQNADKFRAKEHRRRAAKQASSGQYTAVEWQALCRWFDQRCVACGTATSLTVDHVLPLSKGGSNGIENIQPLCSSCNSRKKDRWIDYRSPEQLTAFLRSLAPSS